LVVARGGGLAGAVTWRSARLAGAVVVAGRDQEELRAAYGDPRIAAEPVVERSAAIGRGRWPATADTATRGGTVATLLSVNVGLPKDVAWQGRTVNTGIWKRSVDGPRMVRRLNVDGDGQGDLNGHGGEQRAVLAYQIDSYRYWQNYFGHNDLEFGQFGENFTVDGLSDDEVCIGDRYRIGDAEFEVTQPRVTCFRVGMRMGQPELPALLVAHRRSGFISE
jgi:MOSC domain